MIFLNRISYKNYTIWYLFFSFSPFISILLSVVYIIGFTSKVDMKNPLPMSVDLTVFRGTISFEVSFALIAVMFLLFDMKFSFFSPYVILYFT